MSVKIKETVTADGKKLKKMLEELGKLEVVVGIQEGEKYPDGTSVLDVVMWNELGTETIPSRPFLRDSVDNHAGEIQAMVKHTAEELLKGVPLEKALKELGAFQVGLIQNEIRYGNFKANALITIYGGWMRNKKSGKLIHIKGKNSATPLFDTGRLRQSVHYVIREKGKEG